MKKTIHVEAHYTKPLGKDFPFPFTAKEVLGFDPRDVAENKRVDDIFEKMFGDKSGCPVCKDNRVKDLPQYNPEGKDHLHFVQVDKRGDIVWQNCFIGKSIPKSKIHDVIDAVDGIE